MIADKELIIIAAQRAAKELRDLYAPNEVGDYMRAMIDQLNICTTCWEGDRRCQCWNDE